MKKYQITETVTYVVTAESELEAEEKFLEDANEYFAGVEDRNIQEL